MNERLKLLASVQTEYEETAIELSALLSDAQQVMDLVDASQ